MVGARLRVGEMATSSILSCRDNLSHSHSHLGAGLEKWVRVRVRVRVRIRIRVRVGEVSHSR